jgi:hypothetical protein
LIRQFLDLSTAHLPEDLGTGGYWGSGTVVYDLRYDYHVGFFLWVPDDPDQHADETVEGDTRIREEILVIQRYARSLGCDYVLFDADAPYDPNLPAWEW